MNQSSRLFFSALVLLNVPFATDLKAHSLTTYGNYAVVGAGALAGTIGLISTVLAPQTTEKLLLRLNATNCISEKTKHIISDNPLVPLLSDSLTDDEKEALKEIVQKIGVDASTLHYFEEPHQQHRSDSITRTTIAVSKDMLDRKNKELLVSGVGYVAATIKNNDHAKISLAAVLAPLAGRTFWKIMQALLKKQGYNNLAKTTRSPFIRAITAYMIFVAVARYCYCASEKLAAEKLDITAHEINKLQSSLDLKNTLLEKLSTPKQKCLRAFQFITNLFSYVPSEEARLASLQSLAK